MWTLQKSDIEFAQISPPFPGTLRHGRDDVNRLYEPILQIVLLLAGERHSVRRKAIKARLSPAEIFRPNGCPFNPRAWPL